MRFHSLAFESLETRAMLAGDITAETLEFLPRASLPGDANQDGTFDQSDLVQVLQADKYSTERQAEWSEGDWNGDGRFDQFDLIAALQTGLYGRRAPQPMKAIEKINITVDLSTAVPGGTTADFHFDQEGYGTHLGAFHNVDGTGVWDLVNQIPLSMETTLVAANGDTLHGASSDVGLLHFDGGTGRFADAEGVSKYTTIWGSPPTFSPDNTFTITILNYCEGEITF